MEFPDIRHWAGTEEAFAAYLAALQAASAMDIKAYIGDDEDDDDEPPRLLNKQGDVGVISINGSLVPGAPWYARYTNITGYDEIRHALVAAANDPDIGGILLDINSGGGAVSGVTDVADLVRTIDAKVKPIETFTGGMMASAALWIGASARRVQVGKVAEAGSIGVITVMQSMKKFYEQRGIDTEVLRSAEYKAMGHPLDPINEKAKAEVMDQLMQMDAMFMGYMADARGTTVDLAREKFGKGRVFIGQRAVEVGLVDAVSTFDAVVSSIQGAIDSEKQRSQYGANFSKGPAVKTALTEQQLAAMAEGAGLAAPQAAATAETTAPAAPVQAPGAASDETAPAAAAEEPKAGAQNELVTYLQGQLSAAQAQVTDLTVQVRDLKASAERVEGTRATMRTIVEASVSRLRVALGMSAGATAELSDEAILAEHASLRASFETQFKAGGVAAVAPADAAEKTAAEVDPVRMRRIQANRLK